MLHLSIAFSGHHPFLTPCPPVILTKRGSYGVASQKKGSEVASAVARKLNNRFWARTAPAVPFRGTSGSWNGSARLHAAELRGPFVRTECTDNGRMDKRKRVESPSVGTLRDWGPNIPICGPRELTSEAC